MAVDPTSLKQSLEALKLSLDIALTTESKQSALFATVRSGVIQNFEVSYELSWKLLQRWLRENQSPDEADFPRTRKDLFRLAAKVGLIDDPVDWFRYAEARNKTSHTYYEAHAEEVFAIAPEFLKSAQALLAELEASSD